MPVPHSNTVTNKHIASIRAAVFEPLHDAFQYTGVSRCIGTFINYSKGTQGESYNDSDPKGFFETFRVFDLLRLNHEGRIAHQRPTQENIQQVGMRPRQFQLDIPQGRAQRLSRRHQPRRQQLSQQCLGV